MLTKYILFLAINLGSINSSNPVRMASFTAEFASKDACIAAGELIIKQAGKGATVFVCAGKA